MQGSPSKPRTDTTFQPDREPFFSCSNLLHRNLIPSIITLHLIFSIQQTFQTPISDQIPAIHHRKNRESSDPWWRHQAANEHPEIPDWTYRFQQATR